MLFCLSNYKYNKTAGHIWPTSQGLTPLCYTIYGDAPAAPPPVHKVMLRSKTAAVAAAAAAVMV